MKGQMKRFIIFFILFFAVNCFADESINTGGEASPGIQMWFEEEDGSPSKVIYKIKVTDGTFTDNGDGTGSLANIGAEVDTLDTVTGRGATTTNAIQVGDIDINDTTPHLKWEDSTAGDDDFEAYADDDTWYLTNFNTSEVLIRANTTEIIFPNVNIGIQKGVGGAGFALDVTGTISATNLLKSKGDII